MALIIVLTDQMQLCASPAQHSLGLGWGVFLRCFCGVKEEVLYVKSSLLLPPPRPPPKCPRGCDFRASVSSSVKWQQYCPLQQRIDGD